MPVFVGGANILGGALKSIIGGGQKRKARKMLAELQYPIEQIPSEYTQNQIQAQINAKKGLPSEQYQQAMQNIQRSQMAALRSANDRRGGLAAISSIQQGTNDANLNLDVANAKARLANQNTLYGINNQVAAVKRDLFQKNIRDKYNRDYNYAMGLLGAGNQNFAAGLDSGIAGLGLLGSGLFGSQNQNFATGLSGAVGLGGASGLGLLGG